MRAAIGRPPIGERAMTAAERQRRRREKLRVANPRAAVDLNFIAEQQRRLLNEMAELRADCRLDQLRFDTLEQLMLMMPESVTLRLRVALLEDKLADLKDSR